MRFPSPTHDTTTHLAPSIQPSIYPSIPHSPEDAWVAAPLLYASGVSWTLMYDTIYAHQDREDDARIGLKSTAIFFGERMTKPALSAFAAASVAAMVGAGVWAGQGWPYYAAAAACGGHMAWQISSLELGAAPEARANQNARFVSNLHLGAVLFGGIVAGKFV